jgi:hypothetical protein
LTALICVTIENMSREQISVSKTTLHKRINQKLKKDHQVFCTSRTLDEQRKYGKYYTFDMSSNLSVGANLDMEAYGRELGVLAGWEVVKARGARPKGMREAGAKTNPHERA